MTFIYTNFANGDLQTLQRNDTLILLLPNEPKHFVKRKLMQKDARLFQSTVKEVKKKKR